MAKIRFKLVSRHQDKNVTVLPMSYNDKRTKQTVTLLLSGDIIKGEVPAAHQNDIETLILQGRVPDWSKQGQKESDGHWVNIYEEEYVPQEEEKKLKTIEEQLQNQRKCRIHDFLRNHGQVMIKGPNNENLNPNGVIDPKVELIDISKDILAQEEKNLKIQDASAHLKKVYLENQAAFLNILYAYGIPGIESQEKQVLYNLAVYKLNNNPQEYLDLVAREDLMLRALVQQALNKEITIDGKLTTLITTSGDNYIMEGEYIADTIEKLYLYFDKNDMARERLQTKLGIMPSGVMEALALMESAAAPSEKDISGNDISEMVRAEDIRKMDLDIQDAMKVKSKTNRATMLLKIKERNPLLQFQFDALVRKYDKRAAPATEE